MSDESTHVIKSTDVAASRAVRPDHSLLLSTLRVPADQVHLTVDGERAEASGSTKRLVQRREAKISDESIEVITREPVLVRRPKPAPSDSKEDVQTEPSIEQIEARWQQRMDEEVARAREEGFEAGKASIRAEMEAAVEEIHSVFVQDLAGVQTAWERHLKDARIRLVQLAFRIAGVVLDAPLPGDIRHISESAIRDAVDHMVDSAPIEIYVHPVSYLRLQDAGIEEQLHAANRKIRWRSDPDLKENEWVVQSSRSAVRRLEAELLDNLQRELSLHDVDLKDSVADVTPAPRHSGGAPPPARGINAEDGLPGTAPDGTDHHVRHEADPDGSHERHPSDSSP